MKILGNQCDILLKIFKCLKEGNYVGNIVHQDLGYKSEYPEEQESPMKGASTRIKNSIQEPIGGYMWADSTEVQLLCARSFHQQRCFSVLLAVKARHIMTSQFFPRVLRVNADADTCTETRQTTVKPPCMDSVANGRRFPYVFQ
ncbi:hypothetical protein ACTXT7_013418 [Hymenolepis weldensis]